MSIVIIIAIVIAALVASLTYLAIQVREARVQEARASWLMSPWGQTRTSKVRAEKVWKDAFQRAYRQTGGNFSDACLAADMAAQPYFKAAHAAEELARKASSSAVRKDTEGRLKG